MKPRLNLLVLLLGAVAMLPARATSQVSATLQLGQQSYGHEIRVYPYSRDADGDWHSAYRRWRPTTVYSLNGRFYSRSVPGARAIQVYSYNNQYFLPPQDPAWVNVDRRYRYSERPRDEDYNVINGILSLFGQRPPRSWGAEVVVDPYSPGAFGDWRTGYRRWRPVTLYARDNHYFSRAVPGSRPVSVYSYNGSYFLPPQDQQWDGYDHRFNYRRRPTDDDYRNAQRVQGGYQPQDQRTGQNGQPGARYGADVQVTVYSPQVQGDWRTAYNRWDTATLYNLDGRYYPTQVPGARAVMVYRSQHGYFLPPRDAQWTNADRRYDYRLRPTDDDYTRAQRPHGGA